MATDESKKAKVYLFYSPACPHCPAAKEMMKGYAPARDDIEYAELSTLEPEGQRKAREFGVMSVPTFIIQGPGTPENIGLRGNQSPRVMDKYIDIALGKAAEEKKEKGFKVGRFRFRF